MSKDNPKKLADLGDPADAIWIEPHKIVIESNVRDFTRQHNIDSVEEMADNIIAVGGVRIAVVVRFEDSKCILVDGERRVRGALRAIEKGLDLKRILAIKANCSIRSELDLIGAQLSANNKEDLDHFELSRAFQKMLHLGAKYEEIRDKTGYTNQQITNILQMEVATNDVRSMVIAGELSASLAETTIRKHGPKKTDRIVKKAKKVAESTGSTKVTARHIRKATGESTPVEDARETIKTLVDAILAMTRTTDVAKIHRIGRNALSEANIAGNEDGNEDAA
jgi:ParB-like chromosome segregation protein Spo0J